MLLASAPASARHYRAAGQGWGNLVQYNGPEGLNWGFPAQYDGEAGRNPGHSKRRHVRAGHHRGHAARHYRSESHALGYSASGNSLVSEARSYIGTNPTGWSRVWCGHFVDMILRRTGHKGGGNLAKAYAHYGQRVSGPRVGAIAVMARHGGGGHVGVVSGVDGRGNPIVVSGNTWGQGSKRRRVMESVVPQSRVYAYVMPTN